MEVSAKSNSRFFIVLSVIFISLFVGKINAQNYPQYGTNEWYQLSLEDKNKSLQIPEEKLRSMKTEELINSYLNFPLISLFHAFDSRDDGFKRIYEEFNGLRELINRPDAGKAAIEYYKMMKVGNYDENWESTKKGHFTFEFIYMEILLSRNEILEKLSNSELKFLLNEMFSKYDEKNLYYKLHSDLGVGATVYSIAKVIEFINAKYNLQSNIKKNSELLKGHRVRPELYPEVLKEGKNLISKF